MFLKKLIRIIVGVVIVLLVLAIVLLKPVDDTAIEEQPFYTSTLKQASTFSANKITSTTGWRAAWAAINITPKHTMPMAGYAPRSQFDAVHDSIFIRVLALNNGATTCFIISSDLLIFPPALREKLTSTLSSNRYLYFTATHAHSSLGSWDNSTIGNLILGSYREGWIDSLTKQLNNSFQLLEQQLKPAQLQFFKVNAAEYVENRLDPEHGAVDGYLRGLSIHRSDGTNGLFVTYAAHPTNISHLSRVLSGDYPSALIQQAEKSGYAFAMFGAGSIGSHRARYTDEKEFVFCDSLGRRLFRRIHKAAQQAVVDSTISVGHVAVSYGPSQLHLLQSFALRDWVFRSVFRPLRGNIDVMKIGNVLFLGMPCDFSGEITTTRQLDSLANANGEHLLITSFNGDYVGYITDDRHYGFTEQEEVMALNWVGPHFGRYYGELTETIIRRAH